MSAVTPFRRSRLILNPAEPVVSETGFTMAREGGQIAQGGTKKPRTVDGVQVGTQNVKLLATGAWSLEPFTDKPNNAHRDDGSPALRLSDFNASPDMTEQPFYRRPSDLTGVTIDPHVVATGNYYMVRDVSAGGSWASNLSSDLLADPMPVLPEGNEISISRKLITKVSYPDYQGWSFDTIVAHAQGANDAQVIKTFYFWAKLSDAQVAGSYVCSGFFCVRFLYGGIAQVFEREVNPQGPGGFSWVIMDEWRYGPPGQDALHIHGHLTKLYDDTFGYFNFEMGHVGVTQSPIADNLFTTLAMPAGGASNNSHVTKYRLRPGSAANTTWGVSKVDMPDDGKTPHQLTPMTYPLTGTLVDHPFNIPFNPTIIGNIRLYWKATTPDGTTVDAKVYDNKTGDELYLINSGNAFKEYQLNPRQPNYFVVFTLTTTDKIKTPFLWDYSVVRDAVIRDSTAPQIIIPDDFPQGSPGLPRVILLDPNVSGPEKDETHNTATLRIEDITHEVETLNHRSGHRTRLECAYDPLDPTLFSTYFDGFVGRMEADRKGTKGRVYPNEFWRSYSGTFTAMWTVLKETLTSQIYVLRGKGPKGEDIPLKITDFCKSLIYTAGFPPDMVDIPNSEITFDGLEGNPGIVDSLTPVLDIVTQFLENFLGWYLAWDGNAGTRGMWRALIPPPAFLPYTNLCRFTLDPPTVGKLAMRPESYGTTNWVTQADGTIPTVPIIKRSYKPYVKKPEGSSVYVTATGQLNGNKDGATRVANEYHNWRMFNFIVDSNGDLVETADPNHQDYTNGRFVPIYVVIFGLFQAAVDVVCRRIADVSLHSVKVLPFRCPMPLVIDPNDTKQTKPRPLRYYDPVLVRENGVDAQFLVRSCSFAYRKDHMQYASMELQSSLVSTG